MTLVLEDTKWAECLKDAREAAALRGTEHGFIDWFAKALFQDKQVLFAPGEPETDGDLQEVDSDIGPLLVVYLPDAFVKGVAWVCSHPDPYTGKPCGYRASTKVNMADHFENDNKCTAAGCDECNHALESGWTKPPHGLTKATLDSKISKQGETKGTWISAGRGSKKQTAHLTKIVHRAKPSPVVATSLHQRKPSGFGGEADSIRAQIERKTKTAMPAKDIAEQQAHDQSERHSNQLKRQNQQQASWKAPFTTFSDIEKRAAGQSALRMNPKTGEPYAPPGPYDRWVTMHPWGLGAEGQPVLMTEVPGHKGRFMTIREPGQGRQRFREIRTVTPEDAAKEAVQKRKEAAQKKYEEFLTGKREQAEWGSEKTQAKYSQLRGKLEKWLGMTGHLPYTSCTNNACKELAKEQRLPVVHLYTPAVARAMLQKQSMPTMRKLPGGGEEAGTMTYGETSNDRIRREMLRRAEEVYNWLNRDLMRHERIAEARSKQVLGEPVDVAGHYEGESEKELRLLAGTKNAIAIAERRVKKMQQELSNTTPAEKRMQEMRVREAIGGLARLRDQAQMHAIAARSAADFATSVPTPLAQIKTERVPKADLDEMALRSSSIEEFTSRHDYYTKGIQEKVKEYTELIPAIEKTLGDIRSGKTTGAPPGKTGVKQAVPVGDDEGPGSGVENITAVPASAAMKAAQLEREANQQLNVARVMVSNFSRAAQTLESNAIDPNSQRKVVNYALDQEQQDAKKVIATARIMAAQAAAKAEGRDKRAAMMKLPGGKVEGLSQLDPEFIATARKLADEYASTKEKYKRDERTAEKSRGITIPGTPLFGDLSTEEVVKERMKDVKRTLEDAQSKRLVHDAFAPKDALELLGEDRDNLEKKVISVRHQEGMYSAFHTMSVGTTMEGMVDPAVVNVLGQEGTARAMSAWYRQKAPDKIPAIREKLQKWVDENSDTHVKDVLEESTVLIDEARELQSAIRRREGNPVHMAEIRAMQKQLEVRVRQHVALLSHALGQENAVNSLLGALKENPKEDSTFPLTLGGIKDTNDITTRMSALGLVRGIKEGEGDYTTQKAGNNWLVQVRHDALAKTIRKTHERMFTPEQIQQVEEIKNGVKYVNGKPVYIDDPQYLPPLFSMRQVGRDYGEHGNIARGHLKGATVGDMRERLSRAIGTLGLHGLDHKQAREYLGRESTVNDVIKDKDARAEYHKMLNRLLPGSDGSTVRDRKARNDYRAFIRKMAPGGDDASAQELDPVFASRFVRNAFIEQPHHVLAYKDLDKMDGAERDLLKRHWADNVAGMEYGGRSEETEGKAAWRYFMKKVGGEHQALEIAQELLRDEHVGRVVHHASASGTRLALGQKQIPNSQFLGEMSFKGPLAGLTNRRSLGDRAEAQLRHIANGDDFRPGMASQFKATQQPGKLKPGLVKMYDQFVRQQRAIRQFGVTKRMAVLTEPGSGKTVMALGGFTEARQAHRNEAKKRGEKPTPFRSVWVVPASLINTHQVNNELSTFLSDNALRWHASPLEGEERHAQRVSLMKDKNLDIYVTTPESLREDLLKLLRDFKEVGGSMRHIEGRNKLLDPQTRQSLLDELEAAEPEARRNSMIAALKNVGIDFSHVFVDEGHRLANRPGKRESQMSTAITSMADGAPHFMLATASPAENDFGEVLDLLRKVKPDIFAKRPRKNAELRTPYEHIVRAYEQLASRPTSRELERPEQQADVDVGLAQALRREIAPAVFNVPAGSTGVRGEYAEEGVTLTDHQRRSLDIANNYAATARQFWQNPAMATKAMRWLAPDRFANIPEGEMAEREISERLLGHVETLRRNALDRVLHEGTHDTNAKIGKLVKMVKSDPRMRNTKTGKPGSGIVFVNRIQSARDVAQSLASQGVTAFPITSQENPAHIKKWEREYADSRNSDKPVVLVVTPTGSVGKNYQSGVWTVHFDLPHSSYALEQREGRVNRAGQEQNLLHNIRLYARDEGGNKHELELARERVIRSKAPLMGLFDHEKVSRDDTDLAHLLSLEEMVRPEEAQPNAQ